MREFDFYYELRKQLYAYFKDGNSRVESYGECSIESHSGKAENDEDFAKLFKLKLCCKIENITLGGSDYLDYDDVERALELNIISEKDVYNILLNMPNKRNFFRSSNDKCLRVNKIKERIGEDSILHYLNTKEANGEVMGTVTGSDIFVEMLVRIRKLKHSRYRSYDEDKGYTEKYLVNYILHAVQPEEENVVEKLSQCIEKTNLKRDELIFAALVVPKWRDYIGEYLGIDYLEETETMGRRDIEGIIECSDKVFSKINEEDFKVILNFWDFEGYKKTKLYTLARLGKVAQEEMKAKVLEKRDQASLVAYCIPKLESKEDLIERYNFIREFLKGSKKFGKCRRDSETEAYEDGIIALSHNANYEDIPRFKRNMEAYLFVCFNKFFEPKKIEETEVWVETEDYGKVNIKVLKNGKSQKSIPVNLKKDEYIKELKDFTKYLKDEYKTIIKTLEICMIAQIEYTVEELNNIAVNPVVRGVIEKVIFINDELTGYFEQGDFIDNVKGKITLDNSVLLKVAHSIDLDERGVTEFYKKLFKEKKIKQPFEQIAREFYLLKEEFIEKDIFYMEYTEREMPYKTYGFALKGRGWYQDMKQDHYKYFNKCNIAVNLDSDCNTLTEANEGIIRVKKIDFRTQTGGSYLKIKDIPYTVFSEAIRDIEYVTNLDIVK